MLMYVVRPRGGVIENGDGRRGELEFDFAGGSCLLHTCDGDVRLSKDTSTRRVDGTGEVSVYLCTRRSRCTSDDTIAHEVYTSSPGLIFIDHLDSAGGHDGPPVLQEPSATCGSYLKCRRPCWMAGGGDRDV